MKTYTNFQGVQVNDDIILSLAESGKTVEAVKATEKVTKVIFTILTYLFIVALALIVVFPFYWMIITSLKQNVEIKATTQTFFPNIVMWSNYIHVLQVFDFGKYMGNTIVVAVVETIGDRKSVV